MPCLRVVVCCVICTAVSACGGKNEVSDPIGLVLAGGGSKGAYEVGVWQELQAAGLSQHVTVISGTSVGALNASLIATKPDAVERIWLESMNDVFVINTNAVGEVLQSVVDAASNSVDIAKGTGDRGKAWGNFILSTLVQVASNYVEATETESLSKGYMDSSKLEDAIKKNVPKEWPLGAPVVYATALEKGAGKTSKTWRLNIEDYERRVLMLRASAAIPGAFDAVKIDGRVYIDGGWEQRGGDNVPLKPIIDNHPDVKNVIIVYLDDKGHFRAARREKNRELAAATGVRLVEIIPSENINGAFGIGGAFNASPDTARRLIELGRKDAESVLKKEGLWQKADSNLTSRIPGKKKLLVGRKSEGDDSEQMIDQGGNK